MQHNCCNLNKRSGLSEAKPGVVYDDKRGKLWTPVNGRNTERAAFVGFIGDIFGVDGDLDIGILGRSRGVQIIAPQARAAN